MAAPVAIVRQYSDDDALSFDLSAAYIFVKGAGLGISICLWRDIVRRIELSPSEIDSRNECEYGK